MGKILKTLHSGTIDPILPIWLEKKNDFGRIGGKIQEVKRYCTLHLLGCGSID